MHKGHRPDRTDEKELIMASYIIPEMLTIRQVIERIPGLSYDYLRQACIRGEIVHIRAGKKYLINFDKLCEKLNKESS